MRQKSSLQRARWGHHLIQVCLGKGRVAISTQSIKLEVYPNGGGRKYQKGFRKEQGVVERLGARGLAESWLLQSSAINCRADCRFFSCFSESANHGHLKSCPKRFHASHSQSREQTCHGKLMWSPKWFWFTTHLPSVVMQTCEECCVE